MHLNIYTSTNTGKRRKNNEDNFYANGRRYDGVSDDYSGYFTEEAGDNKIFAVCDGMGGESCGEVASACAVDVLEEYRESINEAADISELKEAVNQYTTEANNRICDEVVNAGGLRGGTTLTLACIRDKKIFMFYLGDSRIYMYRDDVLTRITRDHTVAYEKVDANIYTEEEADKSPDAHKLTMFLGVDLYKMGVSADFAGSYTLTPGDRFLMCSDGLTDMCNSEEISNILDMECENPASELVMTALDNGGKDNVTCLVIEVTE